MAQGLQPSDAIAGADTPPCARTSGWTGLRALMLIGLGAVVTPAVFVACRAVIPSSIGSIAACSIIMLVLVVTAGAKLPNVLSNDSNGRRVLFGLWLALCLLAGVRLAYISVFMLDVERKEYAIDPPIRNLADPEMTKPFFPEHCCFTCYVIGAHLATSGVENIYQKNLYRKPEKETPIHKEIGKALTIDTFQYPPPFLLLPKLLSIGVQDFFKQRTVWFGLTVLVMAITIGTFCVWLGGASFGIHWLAWPAIFLSPTTLPSLQIGNAHFLVICMALLGMLAFESRRFTLGGLLLGFAVAAKIFPGILIAYLLVRRRWAAVAATGVTIVLLCVATVLTFGTQPFDAFINYQLPRLASGEAFAFSKEYIRPLTLNLSVMGAVFKLGKLDMLGADVETVSKFVMHGFTALIGVIVLIMGVRHARRVSPSPTTIQPPTRVRLAVVWLMLMTLAQLRSPFLPWEYGSTVIIWLAATLVAVPHRRNLKMLAIFAAVWLAFSVSIPLSFGPLTEKFDMAWVLTAHALTLLLCATAVVLGIRPGHGSQASGAEGPANGYVPPRNAATIS